MQSPDNLIEIRNLKTHFKTDEGLVKAVDGVDLDVPRGRVLCVVGESGSGKSIMARSIMRIIQRPGRIVDGTIRYAAAAGSEIDLAQLDPIGRAIRNIRGGDFGMVFQEPMTALSPVHTVGDQVTEALLLHRSLDKKAAEAEAAAMLAKVGLPDPKATLKRFPFELSGGMRQRVCIAMALICRPKLLIADEPTTALDVTTQAKVLDLLRDLQAEMGLTVLFITHNLGVVAEIADQVAVMYLGRVVEFAAVDTLFHEPRHPYTQALLRSVPRPGLRGARLPTVRGNVPHPLDRPPGCPFQTRCDFAVPGLCDREFPAATQVSPGHIVRCARVGELDRIPEAAE
jgi:peptide/nickel transport system ATP-binding protein